jgi:hypothetical protein
MEVVLDLIEKSDYIYSRKAFDKCPLPVLICSTDQSSIEYVNFRYTQLFGVPPTDTYTVSNIPQNALRICRTVGKHNISVFLPEEQTTVTGDGEIRVGGVDALTQWLETISTPNTSRDLMNSSYRLRRVVASFGGVVAPLLEEKSLVLH